MTLSPEDDPRSTPPPQQPLPPEEFESVVTQLQSRYLAYQDPKLPMAERVRSAHQFLALGAALLPEALAEYKNSIRKFLGQYRSPKIRVHPSLTADRIEVYTVELGGDDKANQQVPIQDLDRVMRIVESQRYDDYFNGALVDVVADMVVKLSDAHILSLYPEPLLSQYGDLTDADESEADVIEADEDELEGNNAR